MRTTSSIAALHRGHDMLVFVLGSDIALRRLKSGTHISTTLESLRSSGGCRYFLVVFLFQE
jgi:hypothetical protein